MDYKKIIVQWKEFEIPEYKKRDISIPIDSDFINTITGPRRAGKTYFCFQLIDQIKKQKKGIENNILYINFEDEKLLNANAKDLDNLLETFYELFSVNEKENLYLFLDEIQKVKNWDSWVRRIYDTNKKVKIIVTGSSSKLLSKEISTKLRGRALNTEIFPLDFKSYLKWKNIEYNLNTILYSKKKKEIKKNFKEYLIQGGYPSIVLDNKIKDEVLQNYYESMILKDIIERHNLKEIKKLRTLASLLFDSVTKEISYNKIANKMSSLGYNISKNTIIEYVSYFEDSYLFFQNLKYEYSTTKQLGSIKKIYCIDNGLLNSVSFKFSEDFGKLIENLVFLELKKRKKEVFFHRDEYECDFILKEKNKVSEAIQVTSSLNEKNEKREINGLMEALNKHRLKEGLILTYENPGENEDIEKTKTINGKSVKIKPVWKWLLESEKN